MEVAMSYRVPSLALVVGVLLLTAGPLAAQSREELIANALSAAPAEIAAHASVVDAQGTVLREGSNEYTCMPDNPDVPGNSPMCLDEAWLAWAHAWMNRQEPPAVERVSFAYMLQGDFPTSNTDPYATKPTPDNEWLDDAGPHLMILVPSPESLDGISDDPGRSRPYVMWKGTPYVHLMVPTAGNR
ncbi:MAG: hypothetical protein R6X22_06990 [Gemmatimonadota bacterium]